MDNRIKLIVGGAVAVFVVVILYFSLRSKPNILSGEEPKFDIKDLSNIASQDDGVLFAFQGFAKYESADYGKKVYLALAPVTSVSATAANQTLPEVTLKSAHATLSMSFLAEIDLIHLKRISLSTDDGDLDKSCEVEDAAITYSKDKFYECKRVKEYKCQRNDKDKQGSKILVATLTISAIRAEINGKAEDHKDAKYSNQPQECS